MDNGGLGNLTWEFWRHVRPAATVVMQFGPKARGGEYPERYHGDLHEGQEVYFNTPGKVVLGDAQARWLIENSDVIYSAETFYSPVFAAAASKAGVPTVLHSMPELYRPAEGGSHVWVPTDWELSRMPPGTDVVRVPVATDRFRTRPAEGPVDTFVHMAAPAMLDRNGTAIVLSALGKVRTRFRMVLLHPATAPPAKVGNVTVETRGETEHYWESWADESFGALVLPRRYAGLSLPMQEAHAAGLPIVASNLSPQNAWPGILPVQVSKSKPAQMAGGTFPVWDMAPARLAAALDRMVKEPALVAELQTGAAEATAAIAWSALLPEYRRRLEEIAERG